MIDTPDRTQGSAASVQDQEIPTRTDTPHEAAARAWLHSYGILTAPYTRGGSDHPAMKSLPGAFLAFATERSADLAERKLTRQSQAPTVTPRIALVVAAEALEGCARSLDADTTFPDDLTRAAVAAYLRSTGRDDEATEVSSVPI